MPKNRRWMVPLALLVLLMIASWLRWDIEATKSYDTGVVKWERDRWTGDIWIKHYGGWYAKMTLAVPPGVLTNEMQEQAYRKMVNISRARNVVAGWIVFWLIIEIFLFVKQRNATISETTEIKSF